MQFLLVVVPTSATTLWIASPGDQFLLVMKLKRLYISCINTNIVICWTELQLSSGVAKLGHTGARALVTRGCAPPMQALLKIVGAECTTVINRELGAKHGQSLVSQVTS